MLYELPSFEHINARSIDEALSCLRKYGEKARVMGGGTDLLGLMKDRIEGAALMIPEVLVNVKTIPEMNQISYDEEGGLKVGASVTLNRLEASDLIRQKFPVLSEAARHVGTTQLRNMGTIGGNICQRPQCMYFRHPHFPCYKKGGTTCYAVTGEHRDYHGILRNGKCVMAHPSDMAPALMALKAKAVITGSDGTKEIPLEDFFLGPDNFVETALKSDDLVTAVQVPNQEANTRQLFLKHRIRHSTDFALSSVATVAQIPEGACRDIRIVLGGVAPFPYVASKAEEVVKGRKLTERQISRAAEAAVEGARPLRMNHYKVDLTKALVRRALTFIWREATSPRASNQIS
jgi:xanthine dehydrogenase YagS FAD-binding subunit